MFSFPVIAFPVLTVECPRPRGGDNPGLEGAESLGREAEIGCTVFEVGWDLVTVESQIKRGTPRS